MNYTEVQDQLKDFFSKLLNIEYQCSEKNKALVDTLSDLFVANNISFRVQDECLNVEKSVGKQLDTVGEWVGVSRDYDNSVLWDRAYFSFLDWRKLPNKDYQGGFSNFKNFKVLDGYTMTWKHLQDIRQTTYKLGDGFYRQLVKLKIIKNSIRNTKKNIDVAITKWSNGKVFTSWDKMQVIYRYDPEFAQLIGLALYKKCLPAPVGCEIDTKVFYNIPLRKYTDIDGYQKVLKGLHSTFDKSKFGLIGNPNITDDGILTSPLSDNYNYATMDIDVSKNFMVYGNFTNPNNGGGTVCRLATGDYTTRVFNIYNNYDQQYEVIFVNSSGTEFVKKFINKSELKEHFYFKFGHINGKYKFSYKTDGQSNYTDLIDLASSESIGEGIIPLHILPETGAGGTPLNSKADLKAFSISVDGKEVFNGNKTGLDNINGVQIPYTLTNPYNFTKVGNPVISDDGIASGFSNGVIKISNSNGLLGNSSWKVTCNFKTSDDLITQQMLFDNQDGFARSGVRAGFINGKFFNVVIAKDDASVITDFRIPIAEIKPLTSYFLEILFTGAEYIIKLDNVIRHRFASTEKACNKSWRIGRYGDTALPFTGSIDLKEFKITTGGADVFNREAFTVVGTPTITDDGVASGFNIDNKIKCNIPTATNNIIFRGSFTTSSNITSIEDVFDNYLEKGGLILRIENKKIKVVFKDSVFSSTQNLELNTKYYFNVKYSTNNVKVYLSKNNIDFNEIINTTHTSFMTQPIVNIGSRTPLIAISSNYFNGSIDLKQFSISVDGKEVFKGTKYVPYEVSYEPLLILPQAKTIKEEKITFAENRDKLQLLLNDYGQNAYYSIDTENKNYTVPYL